jgi:hypothetical protein
MRLVPFVVFTQVIATSPLRSLRLSTEPVESCEALWREHSEYRLFLYRLDAVLNESRMRVADITGPVSDYTSVSIDQLMSTVSPEMRDVLRALDDPNRLNSAHPVRQSGALFFLEVFTRSANPEVIHQFQSVVRRLQSAAEYLVPLYQVDMYYGFHREVNESFSMLRTFLQQVQTRPHVVPAYYLGTIKAFIQMMAGGGNNAVGVSENDDLNPLFTLRSCRVSENPVAEIERLTRGTVDSMEFCRGLLFRFVPEETRDRWIDEFHELYCLLDQLRRDPQSPMTATHNVQLSWPGSIADWASYQIRSNDVRLNHHITGYSRQSLELYEGHFRRLLRVVEDRSSMKFGSLTRGMEYGSLTGDIESMEATVRSAIEDFTGRAAPLFHRFVTSEEAALAVKVMRHAFLSIRRLLSVLTPSFTEVSRDI